MQNPISLARMIEDSFEKYDQYPAVWYEGKEMTYEELGAYVKRFASALDKAGIKHDDVVAIMLPNIPEFLFALLGAQRVGSVVVPVNPAYKGRELIHIIQDSRAKMLVTLANFMPSINEIRPDLNDLEHIIVVTGKRELTYSDSDSAVFLQMVFEQKKFSNYDEIYHKVGNALVQAFKELGVAEAWYKHKGGIRIKGKKISGFTIMSIPNESIIILNAMCNLGKISLDQLFKVIFVPPEIKDKFIEPTTSIEEETGTKPTFEQFANILAERLEAELNISLKKDNRLLREETFGYDKVKRDFNSV